MMSKSISFPTYNATFPSGNDTLSSVQAISSSKTGFERCMKWFFCVIFLSATAVSAKRLTSSRSQGGNDTTVVTTFYSLICLTSVLRSIFFLLPKPFVPAAIMAFDIKHAGWFMSYFSEVLLTFGSLSLFSIFILVLVYWADILKKYFYSNTRRVAPMQTFVSIIAVLVLIQAVNSIMFFTKMYSTEGMILLNSVILSTVSIVCVVQLLIFSDKFQTVLATLGSINQVSSESQVKRIKWITGSGNAFFICRALLEIFLAFTLFYFYLVHGSLSKVFSHRFWDTYVVLKFGSEFAILSLMFFILESRFKNNMVPVTYAEEINGYDNIPERDGRKVPETETTSLKV